MSNKSPYSWTNNSEGEYYMRKNNMDAHKAAKELMDDHFDDWKVGPGKEHNAIKKWLDRVIRKMIK